MASIASKYLSLPRHRAVIKPAAAQLGSWVNISLTTQRACPVSMYCFFTSAQLSLLNLAQPGQATEAYSTMVTGAVGLPIDMSSSVMVAFLCGLQAAMAS